MNRKPLTTIVTIAYVIFVFIITFPLFHPKQDSGYNIVFTAEQIRSLIAKGDHLKHLAVASPFLLVCMATDADGCRDKRE